MGSHYSNATSDKNMKEGKKTQEANGRLGKVKIWGEGRKKTAKKSEGNWKCHVVSRKRGKLGGRTSALSKGSRKKLQKTGALRGPSRSRGVVAQKGDRRETKNRN